MGDETGAGRRAEGALRDELIETIRECLHYAGPVEGRTEISELIHDSIDLVELISVVGDRYEIRFDLMEMEGVRTVDDLVVYVEDRRGGPATPDPLDRL